MRQSTGPTSSSPTGTPSPTPTRGSWWTACTPTRRALGSTPRRSSGRPPCRPAGTERRGPERPGAALAGGRELGASVLGRAHRHHDLGAQEAGEPVGAGGVQVEAVRAEPRLALARRVPVGDPHPRPPGGLALDGRVDPVVVAPRLAQVHPHHGP